MPQTLAPLPYAPNPKDKFLPLCEVVEDTNDHDFHPPAAQNSAVLDFCLTDVQGHAETLDWFRNLVAMAENSLQGTGTSIFTPAIREALQVMDQ